MEKWENCVYGVWFQFCEKGLGRAVIRRDATLFTD